MIPRLIDFALVVLLLLMFKVYGSCRISKIEFFSFPGLKELKRIKKMKTIQSVLTSYHNHFSSTFSKKWFFLSIFHWKCNPYLIVSLCVTRWTGHDTDLPSKSNISKMLRVYQPVFERIFNKLSSGIQVDRLCTCSSPVSDV